ncbi:MAG: GntR family transcriptional regulator [Candidatus Dormibacteria bacterium]
MVGRRSASETAPLRVANNLMEAGWSDKPEKPDGRKNRGASGESLVESVRRLILEEIIQARIRPGTMLQLTDLAERYGVSRTPVREALSLLERQGLVTAIAYKGYLVKVIEPSDVHDVYMVRKVIEGAATELATGRIRPDQFEVLRGTRPAQVERMTLEYDEYAHDFHRAIVEACGSPRLLAVFEDIYSDVRRMQYAGIGNPRPDLIHAEHGTIVDALAVGDGKAARQRMEEHIDAVRMRALQSWLER